jgi:hypothetical protein
MKKTTVDDQEPRSLRGAAILAACIMTIAVVFWRMAQPDEGLAAPAAVDPVRPITLAAVPLAAKDHGLGAPVLVPAQVQGTEAAFAGAQPVAVPFRFLGKVETNGASSVVLYGAGRTLTVRGTGPADDEYVVDAMREDYVLLRHVSLGTTQLIALVPTQQTVRNASPDDSPQD